MVLRLNELSTKPLFADKYIVHTKMMEFAKTAKQARDRKIKHIKSDYNINEITLTANYTLYNWLFDKDFIGENRVSRDFLQSMIIPPYIDDDKADDYLEHNYLFEDIANGISRQECIGLAAAYLYDDISISLQNGDAWLKNKLILHIEKDGTDSITGTVLNVYSNDCFLKEEIIEYIEQVNGICLIETSIPSENKAAHFSDHHGKNELEHFWNKIANSPYVISARSTEWGGRDFIRKIGKDGMIEIVLIDTERRYALQVQTTGRTLYETECIAKILEEKYI